MALATSRDSAIENLVGGAKREAREPVVSELERQSPLWLKLKSHMEKRIAALRVKNDSDKDTEATAKLRGRIAELKILAALDNPAPQLQADDSE